MTDGAGEESVRASGEAGSEEPAPSTSAAAAADPDPPGSADPAPGPPRSPGVRWGDREPSGGGGADDATPPSGVAAPGPGDVVPARTSGTAPDPTPGAAWPNPGFQPGPWQETSPGWAPPSPTPDPARRRRVRRIVLGTVLGVVLLVVVVVALLAFVVGPRFARYDVLDRTAVERGVAEVVTRDWKRQVADVACPEGERVRPGTTFTCTATVDGRPARVPVDVVDASGTYEVGQPR